MTMKDGNGQKKTEEDGKRRKKTGSGVGGGPRKPYKLYCS
jgi:hypothetical protein